MCRENAVIVISGQCYLNFLQVAAFITVIVKMQGRLELASVTFYVRYIVCIVMVVSTPIVSFLSLRLVPGRVVLPL